MISFAATPKKPSKPTKQISTLKRLRDKDESSNKTLPQDLFKFDEKPNYEDVKVAKLEKIQNRKGKIVNSPVIHYCFYCGKGLQKITRHWYKVHKKEKEVNAILAFPLKPKDEKTKFLRCKDIALLKNKGDYKYVFAFLL